MSLPTLFRIAEQHRDLEQLATDEALDETTAQAIRDTLDGLQGDLQTKAQSVAAVALNLEAWSTAAREASNALAERAARIYRRATALREYMLQAMQTAKLTRIEGSEITLAVKKNPPKVVIPEGVEIRPDYLLPPDPMIAAVVAEAKETHADINADVLILSPNELADIIERHLPPRAPDKKAIGARLKLEAAAREAMLVAHAGSTKPAPELPPSHVPGCSLEQGVRLDIRA